MIIFTARLSQLVNEESCSKLFVVVEQRLCGG